ncbi:uncharacterized protein LOC129578829 [Sitodiplosis mosellana]|uniref:uncharacterized protein LOC129578829 n=1 Tax=Sitodiplosis mosellana TaxID=263140 RepID=UPI0024452B1A|nr:uncharacterized protein LOC129578829 [Sitodiplosis mosellana]XP_055323983.1 uncharacterized protein LOC129578829 [Sitodiplosis mosellana]XP_055323984.1 uncharacterized protein LOC129578829 [Sitodiplosis mosellana]XP_055323985.1 uncharacterized protein LOC129578829 [Sitodiplosis mosellana]
MVNQLLCFKAGGLVLGIIGTALSMLNLVWAIAAYEELPFINDHIILGKLIGYAPDHFIRLAYVIISIFELVAAALLIAGILLKKKYCLLPWIVSYMVDIIVISLEAWNYLILSIVCMTIFGGVIYIWYAIVLLYKEFQAEEEANTGVQMAYVDEAPSQLPPYSVLTIDK